MALFRVYGLRGDDESASILIECDSEAVARNAAVREGFINTTRVEVVECEPEDAAVKVRRYAPSPKRPELTVFDRQPVWTIAKGVFVGLALWTAFILIVGFFLSTLNVLTD